MSDAAMSLKVILVEPELLNTTAAIKIATAAAILEAAYSFFLEECSLTTLGSFWFSLV